MAALVNTAADITRGCRPPTNDLYCPEVSVTRGQMAAEVYSPTQQERRLHVNLYRSGVHLRTKTAGWGRQNEVMLGDLVD
jgi:hypothetical protein